ADLPSHPRNRPRNGGGFTASGLVARSAMLRLYIPPLASERFRKTRPLSPAGQAAMRQPPPEAAAVVLATNRLHYCVSVALEPSSPERSGAFLDRSSGADL